MICRLLGHHWFPIGWGVARCRRCDRVGHFAPHSTRVRVARGRPDA